MAFGNLNVDTITGSGASSVIVNNGTNNVAGFTTGNNLQFLQSNGGIVFNPSTLGSGHSSNTLSDYEEGTWTPTDASGASLTFSITAATYTKVGRLVYVFAYINYPVTANSSAAVIGGLPFTQLGSNSYSAGVARCPNVTNTLLGQVNSGSTNIVLQSGGSSTPTNANLSNNYLVLTIVYQASF